MLELASAPNPYVAGLALTVCGAGVGPRWFVAGTMWPLVWLAVLVTGHLPATDHEIWQRLADREMRLAQRDQGIAELERELGIRA